MATQSERARQAAEEASGLIEQDNARALELLEEAAELDPEVLDEVTWGRLATLRYSEKQDAEGAREACLTALEINPRIWGLGLWLFLFAAELQSFGDDGRVLSRVLRAVRPDQRSAFAHGLMQMDSAVESVTGGLSVLGVAVAGGLAGYVSLLLDHDYPSDRGESGTGSTPLHIAATIGATKIVRLLLDRGADADSTNNDGMTPLMYAAGSDGKPKVAELLLEAGANPNMRDKRGSSPLLLAAGNSSREMARVLVRHGADLEVRGPLGMSPLHAAIVLPAREMETVPMVGTVLILLDAGANREAKDLTGWTPLMAAAQRGYETICTYLIEKGADPGYALPGGQTAASIAREEGFEELADKIEAGMK